MAASDASDASAPEQGQKQDQVRESEFERDPMFALICWDWSAIASIAWEGFASLGRGVILMDFDDDDVTYAYHRGPVCDCHAGDVENYEPAEEVLIVLPSHAPTPFYRIKSDPTPPVVWAVTRGDTYGATEH